MPYGVPRAHNTWNLPWHSRVCAPENYVGERLRLKSDPNQRNSGLDHPSIATIGVPIATMAARIAPQWVSVFRSNQSTTQSLRSKSGS
jgi:hypothetical protein